MDPAQKRRGSSDPRVDRRWRRPDRSGAAQPRVLRAVRSPGLLRRRRRVCGRSRRHRPAGRHRRRGRRARHRPRPRARERCVRAPPPGRTSAGCARRSRRAGGAHARRRRGSGPGRPRPSRRRALARRQRRRCADPPGHPGPRHGGAGHDAHRVAHRQVAAARLAAGRGQWPAPPEGRGGADVIAAISGPGIVGLVVAALVVVVLVLALRQMVNIVQQGEVGVVKHLGEYRKTYEPGLVIIAPFIESLQRVDMREIPRPGDRQDVITKDNVVVNVNATIFTQVVDARQALFSIANFDVAIDALARTALRSVIGTMTLDQALSERERINTDVQQQMEAVTDKWGIRINRIEIIAIQPPAGILEALALEKQADQQKRAKILQSEGQQKSAVNVAHGEGTAAVRRAQAEREAAILRAEGNRQAAILEAEGRAEAITTVYGAIKKGEPDPTLVAILQLDALGKFADSDNAKIVVPFESAGLLGAAQALRGVLGSMGADSNGAVEG